jgi:UDP-N-acetylglucosamine 2-epimerase (non-hydrolysing)
MIHLIAGARPNFVKLAPLVQALRAGGRIPFTIVHTGQHYDEALSGSFFRVLNIPAPEVNLEVGSGAHGAQTARILERYEEVLVATNPRAVVVFGDVTGTLACALAAAKLLIPVVHVEAGLRSFDRTMPEEINRIVTDSLSELLFVSEPSGVENLTREGAAPEKIKLVGNIMIDSLKQVLPGAIERRTHERLGLPAGGYALLTMHRPSNVDSPESLGRLMEVFAEIGRELPIVFPVHPRTRARLAAAGLAEAAAGANGSAGLRLLDSVDYLDSLCLQKHARVVFTDSGGMQEETTTLKVPCVTLRENTERPITVEQGTSTLVGNDPEKIRSAYRAVASGRGKAARPIPLWDGKTAERIAAELERFLDRHDPSRRHAESPTT